MKKIILWLTLMLAGVMLFSACKKEVEPEAPPEPDKIGICLPEGSTFDPAALSELLKDSGYEVTIHTQCESQAKQISLIKDLTNQGYKLLVIEPYIDTALEEIIAAPQEADIPVLVVNYRSRVPEGLQNISFFVDTPTDVGTLQAAQLAKLPEGGDLNGDGVVSYMIITGSTTDNDVKLQLAGIEEALPELPPLATKYTDGTYESAYETACAVLREYGRDVEVIICGSAEGSVGVTEAVMDSGRYPNYDLYIIAAGDSDALTEHFKGGNIFSYVAPDKTSYNEKISNVATAMLNGEEFDYVYSVGFTTVTGATQE